MTTPAHVPVVRLSGIFRLTVLAVFAAVAVAVLASTAPAAPRDGGKAKWVHGHVEKTSGLAIQVRGSWHELARARIVNPQEKAMSSQEIKKGAYINMRLENGSVTYLRVFQDLGR